MKYGLPQRQRRSWAGDDPSKRFNEGTGRKNARARSSRVHSAFTILIQRRLKRQLGGLVAVFRARHVGGQFGRG